MLVCLSSYSWLSGLLEEVDQREKQVVGEHLDMSILKYKQHVLFFLQHVISILYYVRIQRLLVLICFWEIEVHSFLCDLSWALVVWIVLIWMLKLDIGIWNLVLVVDFFVFSACILGIDKYLSKMFLEGYIHITQSGRLYSLFTISNIFFNILTIGSG